MREALAELSIRTYTMLLPASWIALAVVLLVLLPMAAFARTRQVAGAGLVLASLLFGATTWLLGAAVTFASFGWLGLIIGLFVFGVGVVPLAMLAAFFKWKVAGLGLLLVVMTFVTLAARFGGALFMSREDR